MSEPLLSIRGLTIEFPAPSGAIRAVEDVTFKLDGGRTLALVGESGSGKSVTAMSILGLVPWPGKIASGEILFDGGDLLRLSSEDMRKVRGGDISVVFQDPMSSLNPVMPIGKQISEIVRAHHIEVTARAARERAVDLLGLVGIPSPRERARQYPHQFSGGMRQRVMIAMAMANAPKLLIADEPTTALDVTIQAQVLEVLQRAQQETGVSILFITHDLGVVADIADDVAVMYAGRVVEQGPASGVFRAPGHPYTLGLLNSLPRGDSAYHRLLPITGQPPSVNDRRDGCAFAPRCSLRQGRARCVVERPPLQPVNDCDDQTSACHFIDEVPAERDKSQLILARSEARVAVDHPDRREILRVEELTKHFRGSKRKERVYALDDVSITIEQGETLGLVGESGSGKSTLGRAIVRLGQPTAGRIVFDGQDVTDLSQGQLRPLRQRMQLVFQDPYSSLHPRLSVMDNIAEPLRIHGVWRQNGRKRVYELMEQVGLRREVAERFPHEFSGGQRQRVGIARAIALNPLLLVLDEPVSALDVSIQAQTINLLQELQRELQLAYLFISHDLSVVRHISHRISVMYLGRIVETGPVDEVYRRPVHPYTRALLSAVPGGGMGAHDGRITLKGEIPSPVNPPSGCRFRSRCWLADETCAVDLPLLRPAGRQDHQFACHHPGLE